MSFYSNLQNFQVQTEAYGGLNREMDISVYCNAPFNTVNHVQRIPQVFPELNAGLIPIVPKTQEISLDETILWTDTYIVNQKNKYYFQTPFQKYYDLKSEIGVPTTLNPNRGGFAVWQNPGLLNPKYSVFTRIDINDETCYNNFPRPHIGFLYTYIKLSIPMEILNRILSISGDVMYDPIKNLLIIRGMSLSYNIALTTVIFRYVHGNISWSDILDDDLIRKETSYKRLINIKVRDTNLKFLHKHVKPH